MAPINQIMEVVCLVAAILLVNQKQSGFWRSSILFMGLITVANTTGFALERYLQIVTILPQNVILIVKAFYFAFFFSKIYSPVLETKIWVLSALSLFILLFTWETTFVGLKGHHMISQNFLAILIMISSLGYFYFLLKENKNLDIIYHPPFWFVTGLFFYYFGSVGFSLLLNKAMIGYLASNTSAEALLGLSLSFILYSCWIFAFVCRYRQTLIYS